MVELWPLVAEAVAEQPQQQHQLHHSWACQDPKLLHLYLWNQHPHLYNQCNHQWLRSLHHLKVTSLMAFKRLQTQHSLFQHHNLHRLYQICPYHL